MLWRPSVRPSSTIFKDFLRGSETAWLIKAKSRGASMGRERGHMTKMAAMPIYGRNLQNNILLQNQKSHDLETWLGPLGTKGIQAKFI